MSRDIQAGPSGLMVVITTIQEPTACMIELARRLEAEEVPLLAVGDRKGPRTFNLPGARLVTIEEQRGLPFALAERLPEGHYGRKNLGYLLAFGAGASHVYETDDDNTPLPGWCDRGRETEAILAPDRAGWFNVYAAFTEERIWPRGFPLEEVAASFGIRQVLGGPGTRQTAPIQQGLANGSPDVDAVWRLVLDRDLAFKSGQSIAVPKGVWCPFNSQSTWWWPEAYPLMYLPSHCSFRMTDIWRSFVAQRCLWELGHPLVFHAAEVVQVRNEHRLIRDFTDEIPGYLNNAQLAETLDGLALQAGAGAVYDNLFRCYEELVARGWVGKEELPLVRAWIADCRRIFGT